MKTEVTLLNGVRFAPDEHTRLHLHTGDVSATVENLVVPKIGPKVLLRTLGSTLHPHPTGRFSEQIAR